MIRCGWLLVVAVMTASGQMSERTRAVLEPALSIEGAARSGAPGGWSVSPPGTIFVDADVVHGGKASARIERTAESTQQFSTMTMALPVDFAGESVEFSGWVKTADVSGVASIWMRLDGASGGLAFDSSEKLQVKGTTEWTRYTVRVALSPDARSLFVGCLMAGAGKTWCDDFQLTVDGKPIWEVPRLKTAIELDQEFDAGSRVTVTELSAVQRANLVTLGKVWGFLKYHHPVVTAGKRHWDYDLFRVLPEVLRAESRGQANAAMVKWIAGLGEVPHCTACVQLDEKELALRPPLEWLRDEALLGRELSTLLRAVHANRTGKQFYLSLARGVSNPLFEHEQAYKEMSLPDAGFRVLAVYRFWNMVAYWFPYRDVIGEDWDGVLSDALPKVAAAKDVASYKREMMSMIARVHDTHANLWNGLDERPPVGGCRLPVTLRFVGEEPVVFHALPGGALQVGDVVLSLDGAPVSRLVAEWLPFYAASNRTTQLRDIAASMTRGACGEVKLSVRRAGKELEVSMIRVGSPVSFEGSESMPRTAHDRPGETFQKIGEDVGYVKLSSITIADVPKYIEAAKGTKGLIVDIRNYPKEFVVFALGGQLVKDTIQFASFTYGDLANPGAFRFRMGDPIAPKGSRYEGKVVVLVDESSVSQAEYTAMALRGAGARIVGSTTAGADGNVSQIPLPGGLTSMFSGIGVFYPDRRPTQRVGIVPDVEVRPTVEGVRAGRDEVLEAALREIRGK